MKILVTGANGFIGRNLCAALKARGWFVRGSMREKSPMPFVADEMIQVASIDEGTDWREALKGMDAVVHLAARVHIMRDRVADPLELFRRVNVRGAEHLARLAAEQGVKRFIFLSSVKVNGEGSLTPYSEKDSPNPEDAYGISKEEAERALREVARETGMEVVILRPPLVYGPNAPGNFSRFMRLIKRSIPLPLARVHNSRSFIYLGNLTDAIATCLVHPRAANETFIVSDGANVSTTKLLKMIALALKKKVLLFPFPQGLLKTACKLLGQGKEIERLTGSLRVDIRKIRTVLGWNPPFSMKEGIAKTIKGQSL